ncbi:MAG: LamG domain-containing protein, partial [Nanoarchaeota archaeon]|nr:LamG domain-containing protein [Nanoarchaeota archaeon]
MKNKRGETIAEQLYFVEEEFKSKPRIDNTPQKKIISYSRNYVLVLKLFLVLLFVFSGIFLVGNLVGNLDGFSFSDTFTSAFTGAAISIMPGEMSSPDVLIINETEEQEELIYNNPAIVNESEQIPLFKVGGNLGIMAAPSVDTIKLNSTTPSANNTKDNLTIYLTTSDLNGLVKNITNWYVNETSIMVLNMPFENSSDNTTIDYSGSGNNGSGIGSPPWSYNGGYDGKGAYEFIGENSYIDIQGAFPTGAAARAITFWFKAGSFDTGYLDPMLGYYLNGANGEDFIICAEDNAVSVLLYGHRIITPKTQLATNTWYHLAVVVPDGATETDNVSVYINGTLQPLTDEVGSSQILNTVKEYITVGGADVPTSGVNYFNGTIDELQFWNVTLPPDQIYNLYMNKTNELANNMTDVGNKWSACVTPNNGEEDGPEVCSDLLYVLANVAPTIDTMVLNSTDVTRNDTNQNLTLYFNTADGDSDAVKNITNWYLNDTSITVLNMPFERANGTGDTAIDYSGFGHNGIEQGSATWNASGGYDGKGAYEFDGTGDFILVPYDTSFEMVNYTAMAWVRITDLPGALGIMGTRDGESETFDLKVQDTLIHGDIGTGTAWLDISADCTFSASLNTWIHVAYVVHEGGYEAYLNGTLCNSETFSGTPLFMNSAGQLRIGDTAANEPMNGTIDDVMIFNRTLSAEQIYNLYANRTTELASNETSVGNNWSACVT